MSRSYLEVIDRHSRRLGHLVSDLLELSKIESGKTHFDFTRVDMAALVGSLVHESAHRFEEKGLEASCEVGGTAVAWECSRRSQV